MSFKVRRILTAHDAQGRSILGSVSEIPSQPGTMQAAVSVANIWINETMPPALNGPDPIAGAFPMLPQNGGAVFRVLEIAPGAEPHMHETRTIDYLVVLAGELSMRLGDGSELVMRPHDVMIQRATIHGWANRGKVPARFATVVIDAASAR
jgi:quercetin dioxygenase-like cupin family protein